MCRVVSCRAHALSRRAHTLLMEPREGRLSIRFVIDGMPYPAAAVPGQKGYHHVNCQPTSYWETHLAARGFRSSPEDTAEIQRLAANSKHIRETGMLFIRA